MKITICFFGKKTDISDQEKTLLQRINFSRTCEFLCIPQAGQKDAQLAQTLEKKKISAKISTKYYTIALDTSGKEMSSHQFSSYLKHTETLHSNILFLIGGAYGLHPDIVREADNVISLGAMIWTRNTARLMLTEQIYRALEIQKGSSFHK